METKGVKNILNKVIAVKILKDVLDKQKEDKGSSLEHRINGITFKKGDK